MTRLVDVAGWKPDDDNPIFPVGSQPKRLLICPNPAPLPELIPAHRYLFKIPPGWKANQVWSEFIAFRVGKIAQVPVPPCFIARDAEGQLGALIEFFYGYPGAPSTPRFVHASDVLQRFITNKKLGKPHSVRLNLRVCNTLGVANAADWWARTLVFDALIGNTDRHPDNWGFLFQRDGRSFDWTLAPAFDNGTSLGYEIPDSKLHKPWEKVRIQKYIDRGTHHCGWKISDMAGASHVSLCEVFARAHPKAGQQMREMLDFDLRRVIDACQECEALDVKNKFLDIRSAFIISLINMRRDCLYAALGT